MTVASYTSDLTDIFLFESVTGVTAYGGGPSGLGAGPDYAIEGTNAVDKQVSASEKGFLYTAGAAFTIGADDHFFIWLIAGTPGLVDTRDNRGIVVGIGDDTSNFVKFHVNGGDTLPFGGHNPYAVRFVNTALTNLRTLVGTPGTSPDSIGGGANITGTAKFANFGADASRIGTGYDILNGTGADPEADFAGIAADDESTSEGICQTAKGGFSLQGKLRIGSAATACEFLDSNTNIFLLDTLHSLTDFTEILLEHASSILTLTNVNFIALGTNNPGRFEMLTSSAIANLTGVGFIDFGVTVLGTGATFISCRWVGADIVTANSADLTGSSIEGFEGTIDTASLIWDVATDPNGKLDDMSFTKGTAATHAIEFGTSSPLSMTLTSQSYLGYNVSDGQNDSTILVKRTSGTVDITIAGGGDTPSVKTLGATVNIIAGAVNATVTVLDLRDASPIEGANVLVAASNGDGPFPFEGSVTISQTAGTATVAHIGHGMATNDKVVIADADQTEYNGVHQITVTGVDAYTYPVSSGTTSPATGTITSTYVALSDSTNASGVVTMSRVFSTDQPVTGIAMMKSFSPVFKDGAIVGIIDSTNGLSSTVQLVLDE